MHNEQLSPEELAQNFYKNLVRNYLTYGSVDEVFRHSKMDLPISYPGFHHLLTRWDIVKAAGPNTKLSEILAFFSKMVKEDWGLEKLYRQMPYTFKESISVQTLYRVLQHIKEGINRRVATAVIISPEDDPSKVIIGNDISTPRLEYGKPYGAVSLPMGFSRKTETPQTSILRVLQREVFSTAAIERQFPYEIIPDNPKVFMKILIADALVSVYKLEISKKQQKLLSSFILTDLHFEDYKSLIDGNNDQIIRAGVPEIVGVYGNTLGSPVYVPSMPEVSLLNQALLFNYS